MQHVSLNPEGNNLTIDLSLLKELVKKIEKIYPIKLSILIGNTDPYYIYSQSFQMYPNFTKEYLFKKFNQRWKKYKINLSGWLR